MKDMERRIHLILVGMTHRVNGVWYNSYYNNAYSEIPDDKIIEEFAPFVNGRN